MFFPFTFFPEVPWSETDYMILESVGMEKWISQTHILYI